MKSINLGAEEISLACSTWWLLPSRVRSVAEVIGMTQALRLTGALLPALNKRKPGSVDGRVAIFYVPREPVGLCHERIAAIIGEDDARVLSRFFGGSELRLSACTAYINGVVRDPSIRDYWRNSTLPATAIAWLHDITDRQLRNIVRGEKRLSALLT